MRGRGTEIAGELTDSPASLVTFLMMLVHNFSMNSCASMDYWLKMLEKEIKDIVVSKHSLHLSEVERILKGNDCGCCCFHLLFFTLAVRTPPLRYAYPMLLKITVFFHLYLLFNCPMLLMMMQSSARTWIPWRC